MSWVRGMDRRLGRLCRSEIAQWGMRPMVESQHRLEPFRARDAVRTSGIVPVEHREVFAAQEVGRTDPAADLQLHRMVERPSLGLGQLDVGWLAGERRGGHESEGSRVEVRCQGQ